MLQIIVNYSTFNEGLALDLDKREEERKNEEVKTLCHQLFKHFAGAIVKDYSNVSSGINDLEPPRNKKGGFLLTENKDFKMFAIKIDR